MEATFCLAWVNGVFNALAEELCWPKDTNLTNDKMIHVFLEYLKGHPERHNELAFTLARDAFQEAFPCQENEHGSKTAPNPTGK